MKNRRNNKARQNKADDAERQDNKARLQGEGKQAAESKNRHQNHGADYSSEDNMERSAS